MRPCACRCRPGRRPPTAADALAWTAMVPAPVTERVRSRAVELGFDRVGFARAGRAADADRFAAWLAAGREADLGYMRRAPDRRADPARVLPGCRTVVAVTLNHFTPDTPSQAEIPGRVARYARGRDYHRVMEPMLKQIGRAH